jgi:hypothetical protein
MGRTTQHETWFMSNFGENFELQALLTCFVKTSCHVQVYNPSFTQTQGSSPMFYGLYGKLYSFTLVTYPLVGRIIRGT